MCNEIKCAIQYTVDLINNNINTSGVSKSSSDWLNYTRFPGDVCVPFFNAKPPHERRKPSCLQMWRRTRIRVDWMLDFKSMWNISSSWHRTFKIHLKVSHISLLLWRHFHAPKRDAERNELRLVVWHVSQTASWAGLGQWLRPSIPEIQPSVVFNKRTIYK